MIPDFFEPLTAYRAFDVHENGLLVGQAHTEPWPPYQPFVARCGALTGDGWKGHIVNGAFVAAPVFGCDCGIHALKDGAAAQKRVEADRDPFSGFGFSYRDRPDGRAWGTVKVWGRVIEHADGYRAEFAYPTELFCDDEALAPKIAALYGVPCHAKALPKPNNPALESTYISSGFTFWRSPALSFTAVYPQRYGVISSISDDIADTPQIAVPPSPKGIIAPPKLVGANRWQQKQYAGKVTPKIATVDWRQMMRQMVYLNPGVIA